MILIDQTGINPDFLVPDRRFVVHKPMQVIDLEGTYFEESLFLYTVDNSIRVLLQKDVDWTITDDDYDMQAKGKILLLNSGFDKTLVKSVTILRPSVQNYIVSWAGQCLYRNTIEETPITLSEQVKDMLDLQNFDITSLKEAVYGVGNSTLDPYTPPYMLTEDIHGLNPENVIQGEVHKIDGTLHLNQMIAPAAGAFFENTFSAILSATGTIMTEGIDYILLRTDLELTGRSDNISPIKRYIFFNSHVNGDIIINYHAVGGAPTAQGMQLLDKELQNILSFLEGENFLTENTLARANSFISANARITQLEETVRRLLIQNLADYTDIGQNTSILLQALSPDTDMHWYDVATLYKVAGSDTISEYDQCTLSIGTGNSKMLMTATFTVNLHAPVGEQFSISVSSDSIPSFYRDFEDYANVNNRVLPLFRAVWKREANGVASGVVLQIGLQLREWTTEQIAIENKSGVESCWLLIPQPAAAVGPNDLLVTLPDARSWALGETIGASPTSFVETLPLPILDGILAYGGSLPASSLINWTSVTSILPESIDVSKAKSARIDIFDGVDLTISSSTINFARFQDIKTGAASISGDTTGRQVAIKLDNSLASTERVSLRVDVAAEDNTGNRYSVRQVLLMF